MKSLFLGLFLLLAPAYADLNPHPNVSKAVGILPVLNGGTGVTTATGTGSTVRSVSPTLTGTTTVDSLVANTGIKSGSASTISGSAGEANTFYPQSTQVSVNNIGVNIRSQVTSASAGSGQQIGLQVNSYKQNTTAGSVTDAQQFNGIRANLTVDFQAAQTYTNTNSTGVSGVFINALTNTNSSTLAITRYSALLFGNDTASTGGSKVAIALPGTWSGGTINALIADTNSFSGNWFINYAGTLGSSFGGFIKSTDTTASTSTTTGSGIFGGGVGIAGALYVGGAVKVGSSSNYRLDPCENDAGNSSTAQTLDLSTCAVQKSTLTGNVTYTLSNPVTGGAYVIKIATGAGSFTVTWPAAVKWSGGVAPTITVTASKTDIINLYYDGTNYYGTYSQNY